MRKGENKKAFAYYEVIPHLKVDEFACPAYLYKRFDTAVNKEVEHKSFYLGVPVPNTKKWVENLCLDFIVSSIRG